MSGLWEQILIVFGGGIFALQFSLMFNFTVLSYLRDDCCQRFSSFNLKNRS